MNNHNIRFPSKKRHPGYRFNIYFILWTLIIIGSVYLLLRFAAISFSEEIGQAEIDYREAVIYYIGNKVMEKGSPLISYTMAKNREEAPFPFSVIDNPFSVGHFIKDKSRLMAMAKEYDLNESYVLEEQKETASTSTMNTKTGIKLGGDLENSATEQETEQTAMRSGIKIYSLEQGSLSKEYILTNGAIHNQHALQYFYAMNGQLGLSEERLEIGYAEGEIPIREHENDEVIETSNPGNVVDYTMEQLKDLNFLVRNFYIVDPSTRITEDLFNAEELLAKDMKLKQSSEAPQILIYHTHSQEAYSDSRDNEASDTVVGVGSFLEQILKDRYGYNVIHDTTVYDIIDGKLDRSEAYNKALAGITKILGENPTIEVVIDLHRDGAPRRSTIIDGEETAQIMLFNGLCRDENGPLTRLDNPNLQDNLAFSLQLQLKGIDLYPGLFYKNYLQCWRYNMHVREKTILMELGTDKNSLQSAMNAMEPFAEVLNEVLEGR
jgi:stage II sporulation protein P